MNPTPANRHPSEPLDAVHVISPEGRIRTIACGSGISCAVLDAKRRITDTYADRGWVTVEKAYADEFRPELFAAFLDMQQRRRGGEWVAMPDNDLPRIVLERRAARPRPAATPPKRAKQRGSK